MTLNYLNLKYLILHCILNSKIEWNVFWDQIFPRDSAVFMFISSFSVSFFAVRLVHNSSIVNGANGYICSNFLQNVLWTKGKAVTILCSERISSEIQLAFNFKLKKKMMGYALLTKKHTVWA